MNLQATHDPLKAIGLVASPTQPSHMHMYMSGYEKLFNEIPVIKEDDKILPLKLDFLKKLLQFTGREVGKGPIPTTSIPEKGQFNRVIIGIEKPEVKGYIPGDYGAMVKPGAELIVAKWGKGFTSPVHGHSPGYIHEEVIKGRMLVNTFRRVGNRVRPIQSVIAGEGTISSVYAHDRKLPISHPYLIHSFVALEDSVTLHLITEHSLDGNGNTFEVEYFDDYHKELLPSLSLITREEATKLEVGEVLLVKSSRFPEYGNHYCVISGDCTNGIKDVVVTAPHNTLLNDYPQDTFFLLNSTARNLFHEFHKMGINDKGELVIPQPDL